MIRFVKLVIKPSSRCVDDVNLMAANKIHQGQHSFLCVSVASGNVLVCTQWWEKFLEPLGNEQIPQNSTYVLFVHKCP